MQVWQGSGEQNGFWLHDPGWTKEPPWLRPTNQQTNSPKSSFTSKQELGVLIPVPGGKTLQQAAGTTESADVCSGARSPALWTKGPGVAIKPANADGLPTSTSAVNPGKLISILLVAECPPTHSQTSRMNFGPKLQTENSCGTVPPSPREATLVTVFPSAPSVANDNATRP